jgi:hypothetical protein
MPSASSNVGPLTLPLAPGAPDSAVDDPTVSGLADYLRFCIRFDLNAKLANLSGTSADAVPAGNVFLWNPLQPGALFTRGRGDGAANPFPALYVWGGRGRMSEQTLVYDAEERDIGLVWLFDELLLPGALVDRSGLRNAVIKSIERAISRRAHPAYSYQGGPTGVPIAVSLGLSGRGILLTACDQGMLSPVPSTIGAAQASDQPAVRAFPAVMATLQVCERVQAPGPVPADVGDVYFTPALGGPDPLDPLILPTRLLPTT